jgi:hypothetical protein
MAHDTVELACRLADQHRYREAFRLLLRSGRNGDSRVYLNLGFAYDVGQGIRRSKAKALHWYRRPSKPATQPPPTTSRLYFAIEATSSEVVDGYGELSPLANRAATWSSDSFSYRTLVNRRRR